MSLNAELLRESFELVTERNPQVIRDFYEILFERYPQTRSMFGQKNALQVQERMLAEALVSVLDHLDNSSWLEDNLMAIGARHVRYGVADEMYDWVGECLLAALERVAAEDWTEEMAEAWTAAYGAIASLCLKGAEAERLQPA